MNQQSTAVRVGLTVAPILLSLAITSALILAVGADPIRVFTLVGEGAFRDLKSLSQVINFWIPLALVSLGLVVTFTAGLWNIGVEGQMAMGAVFASWGALTLTGLPPLVWVPVNIGLAVVGAMLWAALCGFLKTRLGVHEIFGGVALNFLAQTFAIYMISGPWQPPEGGSARGTPPFADDSLLKPISPDLQFSLLAFALVIIAIVVITLALRGTRWGLQLKATGKNARSALLLGVPTNRSAMSAFLACGALAGVAGSYRVLFTYTSLRPFASGGIGFLGLLVVLLVSNRALWTPFVAFGFAAILGGSTRLKVALQLDSSLAGVLQGVLVLVVLLFQGVRTRLGEQSAQAEVTPAGESDPQVNPMSAPASARE